MAAASPAEAQRHDGACYCGAVTFTATVVDSARGVFCHCESCRHAHAAPVYFAVWGPPEQFALTGGADKVKAFRKEGGAGPTRAFCTECGTRVFNAFGGGDGDGDKAASGDSAVSTAHYDRVAFFPALLATSVGKALPPQWAASAHVNTGEALLDMDKCFADGLPRRSD